MRSVVGAPSLLFGFVAACLGAACGGASHAPPRGPGADGGSQAGAAESRPVASAAEPPAKPLRVAEEPGASRADGVAAAGREPSRASGDVCGVQVAPPAVRQAGSLTITSPPQPPSRTLPSRMRNHIDGSLSVDSPRTWVGPDVPAFVQVSAGSLELFLLDAVTIGAPLPGTGAGTGTGAGAASASSAPDGHFAFYRDPYDASSCRLSGGGSSNCAFGAALYHCSGKLLWVLTLNSFLSRPDHLEIQDIRYDGGVLYFNEACQTYSKEAGGRCSSLVAVDPVARQVLWKTPPLVSNNQFLVTSRYLITGYGFTAEPDFLFIVKRSDGKVVQRIPIPAGHEGMSVEPSGELLVPVYGGTTLRFRMEGFDGDKPRLVKLGSQPSPPESRPSRLGF